MQRQQRLQRPPSLPLPEIREPATSPFPVETPSSAPAYKPGDVYGPVAPGEGLWGIALKIRPEGITREQMMQALFKANPQAFSSAGIDGLKIGATLRIPTYREIADFTGSAVARRLAAVEEHPATPVVVADRTPLTSTPEVFPLALVPTPEPVAIIKTPAPDSAPPASLTPSPPIPEPVATIAEPEPKAPQMPEPEPETPKTSEPVATAPESDSLLLEPISATPLLFLAVSEIMADAVQIPMVVASEPAPTAPPAAEPSMQVAVEEPPAESSTPVSAEEPPVAQVAVEEPPVAADHRLNRQFQPPPKNHPVAAESPLPVSSEKSPVAEEPPTEAPTPAPVEEPPVAEEPPAEPSTPVSSEKSPVAAEPPTEPPTPSPLKSRHRSLNRPPLPSYRIRQPLHRTKSTRAVINTARFPTTSDSGISQPRCAPIRI